MKKNILSISIGLSLLLILTACSQNNQTNNSELPSLSPSESTMSSSSSTEVSSTVFSSFDFKTVPADYLTETDQSGKLVDFSYDYQNEEKDAVVYLPNDYDETKQYNIMYLMHGGGGNETTYMGYPNNPTDLKNVVDHLIENEQLAPTIFVLPAIEAYGTRADFGRAANTFYNQLNEALMPAVEGTYNTYAETTDQSGFQASRMHRAFGGFSLGAVTTWSVMANDLNYFGYFLPMSGDSWLVETLGGSKVPEETAKFLAEKVESFGYSNRDYFIYSASGGEGDDGYIHLPPQIEAMKEYKSVFDFTKKSFNSGNFTFYTVSGNLHDYPDSYDYLYSGLQQFFKQ